MLNSIILSIVSSIDSFGIGITYGIKNTKISLGANLILFFISFLTACFSVFFGNVLINILPAFLVNLLGSIILICMGVYILFEALNKKANNSNVFNNPISSDLDNSHLIDYKESLFLAIAMSLDSFCIGIGGNMINLNKFAFPFLISTFQLLFLSLGIFLGKRIYYFCKLPKNVWSILSGLLLILIGISKF